MTAPTIKAIETHYKGYRFRSRLEARWAVCYDNSTIFKSGYQSWDYEPEGVETPHGRYLPDFLVHNPNWKVVVEIKPAHLLTDAERADAWSKIYWAAKSLGARWGFLVEGLPWDYKCWCLDFEWDEGTHWFRHALSCWPDSDGVRAAKQARFEHGERP